MGDDSNRPDVEYEEQPARPYFKAGFKSIESMTESRNEDRKSTKKRVRTLQDTRGAPGSIYICALWLNRLEDHAAMNKISSDPVSGPLAENLIRFIETVVEHIKVVIKGKPAPQLKTVQRGMERYTSNNYT